MKKNVGLRTHPCLTPMEVLKSGAILFWSLTEKKTSLYVFNNIEIQAVNANILLVALFY